MTLAGHSGGAAWTTLHLASPMSRGLLHRAIVLSGPAFIDLPNHHLHTVISDAERANCPTVNIREMIDCLQKVKAYPIFFLA